MNKNYKLVTWHALVAVLSLWMWSYGRSVSFNGITGLNFNFPAGLAFVLEISTIALGYILFPIRRWALSIALIVGVTFMAFFGFTWLNLLAVIGFGIFNLYSANNVKGEMTNRTKLNIRVSLMSGLYAIIIGFFLMISFAAYQSQIAKDIEKTERLPSQIQTFFQQVSSQMYGSKIPGTPKQKQAIFQQIASEAYLGINSFFKPYFKYAPPILSFALFLILLGLSWVFAWIAMGVGLLMFWVLKKTRVVRVEERDVRSEILVL
ncbi:MAG: hypothetical protein KBC81_02750 [Candidatus Pacebacteria bacterium]|nr:hypothetical protein [Candidatus Paceibacterota bacterium]